MFGEQNNWFVIRKNATIYNNTLIVDLISVNHFKSYLFSHELLRVKTFEIVIGRDNHPYLN